jgi:uncharacterized delta-60 repeat protein
MTPAARIAFLAAASVLADDARADDSDLDLGFGSDGLALTGLTTADGAAHSCFPIRQPDGRLLVCGSQFDNVGSGDDFFVARFDADGRLDSTFSFDGRATVDFDGGTAGSNGEYASAMALQADGKIVLAGTTKTAGDRDFAIARLNGDGTLDTTFGAGTGKKVVPFNLAGGGTGGDVATSVAIQADGRIVVVGDVLRAGHASDIGVLRLLPDGTPDASFNLTGKVVVSFDLAGGTLNDSPRVVRVDSANRLLIGGYADGPPATGADFIVARLTPSGTLDADFDADGRVVVGFDVGLSGDDFALSMVVQPNGAIVLGGYADVGPSGTNYDMAFARLLPDGSLDAGFGVGGRTLVTFDLTPNETDAATDLVVRPDGKILAAGIVAQGAGARAAAVQLLGNAALDPGFGSLGRRTYDFAQTAPGTQGFLGVTLDGAAAYVSGVIALPGSTRDYFLSRLRDDTLFANGFDG